MMGDVIVLIPCYNPDERFRELINQLSLTAEKIIVIDDGSISGTEHFAAVSGECTVLSHPENRGKGAALKSGFLYVIEHCTTCIGCVTADADGQHSVEDIKNIIEQLKESPYALTIGCRSIELEQPFRSWLGNWIMRLIFLIAIRKLVSDTQTGLRAIPRFLMDRLILLSGNRYEFESQMLLCAYDNNVPIKEFPIGTIYWGNNETSHFRTYVDFVRIIVAIGSSLLVVRYLVMSVTSFIVDNSIFAFFYWLLAEYVGVGLNNAIAISVCIARIISGNFHYMVNCRFVFRTKFSWENYGRYLCAVLCIGLTSYILTSVGTKAMTLEGLNVTIWKVFVEVVLLIVSFFAQRFVVFGFVPARNRRL